MANDPNRDVLPVKEDYGRTRQGHSERIDHQSLSKLSRCELEDKVHRLLDEQIHLKKLSHTQEEKIKRLGTKLLRLINDKKHGGRNPDQPKVSEDLHYQYTELEHENYALKDKVTVLRQQLASHSRQCTIRSPVRSNHTSPLMSMRQSASQLQNEIAFQNANKTGSTDAQLQEAEAHIKVLNNEIRSLHNKIEYLQQDLEKNSLDNRKTKVTENIEFIRLQRSLKQQAIQIAALQAQIKNSEHSQRILKEELLKAHNENDEALHLIAVKQNEILNLCSKLEDQNLNRLEEDNLKQRINDLMLERDSLKERADLLMKTIEGNPEEMEKVKVLKKLLAQEKGKTKKLEEILGVKPKYCTNANNFTKDSVSSNENSNGHHSFPLDEKKEEYCMRDTNFNNTESLLRRITYESLEKKDGWTTCAYEPNSLECKSVQTESVNSGLISVKDSEVTGNTVERDSAEKIKMELEVQHLREMLRSQTSRCEAQQTEINRLMLELKLNEDKCKSTLQKLDKRLRVFENLEMRSRRDNSTPSRKTSPIRAPVSPIRPMPAPKSRSRRTSEESLQEGEIISGRGTNGPNEVDKIHKQSSFSEGGSVLDHHLDSSTFQSLVVVPMNSENNALNEETKKRFVDQVFLESSDEDQPKDVPLEKISGQNVVSEKENLNVKSGQLEEEKEVRALKSNKLNVTYTGNQKSSPLSSETKLSSDLNLKDKNDQNNSKVTKPKVPGHPGKEGSQKILISILWLDIDASSSLWNNDLVKLLFIDFTFLDLRGEITETPESLPKPTFVGQKCEFNFLKEVEINENRRKILQSLMNKSDLDLIIFKVVSDSDDFDQLTDFECEDVGVAVVTVKQFLEKYNKGFFSISVKNTENTKEVIGTLAVSIEITPGLFNPRN